MFFFFSTERLWIAMNNTNFNALLTISRSHVSSTINSAYFHLGQYSILHWIPHQSLLPTPVTANNVTSIPKRNQLLCLCICQAIYNLVLNIQFKIKLKHEIRNKSFPILCITHQSFSMQLVSHALKNMLLIDQQVVINATPAIQ